MTATRHLSAFRRWLLPALVALALVAPVAAEDTATSATGLIVDTGDGEPRYVVVTLAEPESSAMDVLRAANLGEVTVDFGGLGEAVCTIDRTGCDVSACRRTLCQTGDPESPFWQYWQQDAESGWALSPLGASHARVRDGDIGAWIWTGSEPDLEPISWQALVSRAGAPEPLGRGEITGQPSVYVSGTDADSGSSAGLTGTMGAIAAVAVVGIAGAWLVLRQRNAGTTP